MVANTGSFKEVIGDQMEISFIGDHLYLEFLKGEISLETAKSGVKRRKEIMEGKEVKIIISLPKLTKINKEVRDYLSSDEATEGIIAGALISNTALSNVIINFFLGVNPNMKVPTKIFSNQSKAIAWLNSI